MDLSNILNEAVVASKATSAEIVEVYKRLNSTPVQRQDMVFALFESYRSAELIELAMQLDNEDRDLYFDVAVLKAYAETCVNINSLLTLKNIK